MLKQCALLEIFTKNTLRAIGNRNSMEIDFLLSNESKVNFKKRVRESIIIHPKQFSVEGGVMKVPSYMAWCI